LPRIVEKALLLAYNISQEYLAMGNKLLFVILIAVLSFAGCTQLPMKMPLVTETPSPAPSPTIPELSPSPTPIPTPPQEPEKEEAEAREKQQGKTIPEEVGGETEWPEWLKLEREEAKEDVRQMEEWAQSVGWKSLQNDNLPQFLEWAKEHEIKFIGTRLKSSDISGYQFDSTKDGVSITAVPGIDIIFKELNNFPPHLIKLLRGTTIYLSIQYGGSTTRTELNRETNVRQAIIIQTKPPDEMTHELAHALDMISIRVDKSSEFTIGKTDEEVRLLREEFERVFQVPKEEWTDPTKAPPGFVNIYASTNSLENFASHFDYYINQPEYFRERAAKELGLAEKYEFLKTKIFLGQEY
jgi:hypothetical protein